MTPVTPPPPHPVLRSCGSPNILLETTAVPPTSRFVRACRNQPVDRTPVWFLRQAGRYMPEYMAVRKHHSLLEICRTPSIAAEVTITAAERLGVDAAIIFADLLLPFTPMGLDFEFVNGEGPVVHHPIRTLEQIQALRTDRTEDLLYVSQAIEFVAKHFALKGTGSAFSQSALKGTGFSPSVNPPARPGALAPEGMPANQDQLGIIGFVGAPFTLASYMIEGGSSRNYIEAKKLMYASRSGDDPGAPRLASETWAADANSQAWPLLMEKLVTVITAYAAQQVAAGAHVIQVFDSWAGALSVADYRDFCLAPTTELIRRIRALGVPVIYFGVDTASLLPTFAETTADVLGLDWRIPLDQARQTLGASIAVQGNLDPITLFAPESVIEARVREILAHNASRPGHIFNLGHGIVPNTPVDAVLQVVRQIKQSQP
jgi:uroporphyrinogen decarboxylase